ncbi:MAG: manganese-dependent inorganic pyrophosphatase [Candidatus Pacebacteria bacterium]|nr:manganese-dependent inorganic pyrophosphatase [Candidatus Paceibacterota bacterium]
MPTKSPTIIIGHKNPDTDSVASVLAYSNLKAKLGESVEPAVAGPLNNETKFVLSYLNIEPPKLIENLEQKQVILLDHGDLSQIATGIDAAEIMEIIDHHKIGDIQTESPILYRAEPVGSTCTILAKLFKEERQSIEKKIAGLLLAGIISDTLFLSSPATTELDKKTLQELAEIAEIEPKEFAQKMFEAKSDISSLSVRDIIGGDYKEFECHGIKFGVGVFETLCPEKVREFDSEIFKELLELKKENAMGLIFFLLVDILKQESFMYLVTDEEADLCKQSFSGEIKNKVMFLPGVVSRKKQVIPVLTNALARRS